MWMTFLALWGCGSPAPTTEAPSAPAAAVSWDHFGAPFALDASLPASEVLADPEAHSAGAVRMVGELTEVCQKMGCWAVVRDDQGRSVRVTMKEHAFGINPDSRGMACDVEGQLVRKAVDPERLAHYASEGAKTHPEEGKTEAWELVATAVATRAAN